MKPKWQRARILHVNDDEMREYGFVLGATFWAKAGPPALRVNGIKLYGRAVREELPPCFDTNLLHETPIVVRAEDVELLARDENDFAEDVPLIPWEEFLAHARDMHRDAPKEIPK